MTGAGDHGHHWDAIHRRQAPAETSWHEPEPVVSLELITALAGERAVGVIDVGGGASDLVDHLLALGHADLTVLDISPVAISLARRRIGADADRVEWIVADLRSWTPTRRYDVWHDRALFHFLVAPEERRHYAEIARAAIVSGGHAIIATFAPDGPERCSGLPVRRASPEALAEALAPGFALVRSLRRDHVTPSGVVQPFTWAVLRRD
jgi:trans-aconitate methyltransferase